MKHIPSFNNFLNEDSKEPIQEGNYWGEYNTPEGKKGAAELDKVFGKFEKTLASAYDTMIKDLKKFKSSDLANKSGLNDTEGDIALNHALSQLIKKTFSIDVSVYDFADSLYEKDANKNTEE